MKIPVGILIACCTAGCAPKKNAIVRSISLERTGCYGTCPAYTVTLAKDGSVTFDGRSFVAVKGISKKQISPGKLTPVFSKLDEIGFWDLKEKYDLGMCDAPFQTVTVLTDLGEKKVEDAGGASEGLQELKTLIDQVAGVSEWVGDPRENKR